MLREIRRREDMYNDGSQVAFVIRVRTPPSDYPSLHHTIRDVIASGRLMGRVGQDFSKLRRSGLVGSKILEKGPMLFTIT